VIFFTRDLTSHGNAPGRRTGKTRSRARNSSSFQQPLRGSSIGSSQASTAMTQTAACSSKPLDKSSQNGNIFRILISGSPMRERGTVTDFPRWRVGLYWRFDNSFPQRIKAAQRND
jgi:hypothetical protein